LPSIQAHEVTNPFYAVERVRHHQAQEIAKKMRALYFVYLLFGVAVLIYMPSSLFGRLSEAFVQRV
jgi:hypothetical protein